MNRREMMSMLGVGVVGSALVKVAATPPTNLPQGTMLDQFNHNQWKHVKDWVIPGWEVRWTGWKGRQDSQILASQWLAHSRNRRESYYRNVVNGIVRRYQPGETFDMSTWPQTPFCFEDIYTEEGQQRANHLLLISFIDIRQMLGYQV